MQVLSDPEKRAIYDQYGEEGLKGMPPPGSQSRSSTAVGPSGPSNFRNSGTILVTQMISLPSSWQATRLTPSTKTGRNFSKDHIGLHQGTVGAKLLLVHGRRMVLVQASQKSHCLWKKHYLAPLKSCTMEQKGK